MNRVELATHRCSSVAGSIGISILMVLALRSAAVAQEPGMVQRECRDLQPLQLPEVPVLKPKTTGRDYPYGYLYTCPARFSPDSRYLTIPWKNTILVWDVATRQEVRRLSNDVDYIANACFSANGEKYASGTATATTIWDVPRGWKPLRDIRNEVIHVKNGQREPASGYGVSFSGKVGVSRSSMLIPSRSAMSFSPDGKRLARLLIRYGKNTELGYAVGVYDVVTGQLQGGVEDRDIRHPANVSFSDDGKLLKVGGYTGKRNKAIYWPYLTVYNASTLKPQRTRKYSPTPFMSPGFVFSRDGSLVTQFRGFTTWEFELLDTATWNKVASLGRFPPSPSARQRNPLWPTCSEISVDNSTIARSVPTSSNTVWLNDIATGRLLARLQHPSATELSAPVCFSDDGDYLLTMTWETGAPVNGVLIPDNWGPPTFFLWDLRSLSDSTGGPENE